ncbi:hypothetical protein P4284_07230 [Bacillus swezeyi]|uniref:hypothetical protein n=1 Tax=Bacillus swezeyi TaxID=1925020 RepID=UPI002E24FC96|nr:hypothetical protein [Bacillus swezeyi]MED2976504.1 hypothetical protein [Bacillus swezeyi]
MKKDRQILKETKEAADIAVSYGSKNDEKLLAYLAKLDTPVLSRLRVYFSNPTFTLIYFIKWGFASSLIGVFLPIGAFGAVPYIPSVGFLPYLIAVVFLLCIILLIRLTIISRKGVIQSILHFAKRSENARIVSMIDFVLKQRFANELSQH